MEITSFVATILLSLVAYCVGVVSKGGQSIKLQLFDLFVVSIIWASAIYSSIALEFNKWVLLLVWIIFSFVAGILLTWRRKIPLEIVSSGKVTELKETSRSLHKRLWARWQGFWDRVGSFQSRLVLSMLFFILVSPFALGVKIFSDPLRIKDKDSESYWLSKMRNVVDLDEAKRQF